ncbi:MAG: 4Fe-4S dicluster domain-containing protein, partial [Methanoregula sp.]
RHPPAAGEQVSRLGMSYTEQSLLGGCQIIALNLKLPIKERVSAVHVLVKDNLPDIMEETSRCIKCYSCISACPICYCVDCTTKNPVYVKPGEVPPNFMFHLIRFAHIADSCVNCGQCQELCPAEIPNALFMHAQQVELEKMFGHVPGVSMELPLMAYVEEKQERARLKNTGSDMIYENVFSPVPK